MVNLANEAPYAGYMPRQQREEPEKIDFPQRLAALRKERNLTQQALAQMVGMGITQIKRYEAGASQPTLDAIRNLAKTLHVSSDELLFGKTGRGPDEDLRFQFEAVSKFDAEDRKTARALLDGLILRHQAKRMSEAEAK
jgi:transcriptional regulator with XRE-family HTH domain